MGATALAAIGIAMGIGGSFLSASDAKKRRRALEQMLDRDLPNIDDAQGRYFRDLLGFSDEAEAMADRVGEADVDRALRLRERAAPGIGDATKGAISALAPLLRGELPPSVMQAFQTAGGASTVGAGFGGSPFGFLNQGLFGARGALGAMQTGFGLLPSLMSALPNVNTPSTAAFLDSIMTPAQRVQTQLAVRQQNIGIAQGLAGMPTSSGVWGDFLQTTGGQLAGAGAGMMGGGGSGLFGGGLQQAPSGTGFGNIPSSNMGYLGGWERLTR